MATPSDNVAATMAYAFITWDANLGRRMCPLATFGSRAAGVQTARLVCVDPPRADREILTNANDVRGAIALVVRGGCSFSDKARRLQAAGAVAMILANNTREEPFEMFTMAADDPHAVDESSITIPCVMMCLYDVRELFKQYPPSVKTGVLTLEILPPVREQELVAECERQRLVAMQQHTQQSSTSAKTDVQGSGWGASLKRTTTSLIKRWDSSAAAAADASKDDGGQETRQPPLDQDTPATASEATIKQAPLTHELKPKQPLFAFVQWVINASEYVVFFAPLADFCLVANNAVYEGRRVACDPLLANQDPVRNAKQLVDAIALVQRGACTFPTKLERVQRCGAAAAIVGNDDETDEDAAFVMSVDQIKVDHLTIPAVMVSRRVFKRLLEEDQPSQLRILCLSGEAAAECLARVGTPISLTDVQPPVVEEEQQDTQRTDPVTRLHQACRAGDHGKCQQVLDECCAHESARCELVMARGKFQLTALHHACASSTTNEHVVNLLLQLGAQPDARDLALQTPLHLACLGGDSAIVKKLLSASFASQDLTTAKNLGGSTPIHYAAMAGSTACLEVLLSVNARRIEDTSTYRFDGVDERDVDGATPLHVACTDHHVDCVMYLIAANADLEVKDNRGCTALQIACAMVNDPRHSLPALHIVEKLMDAGAAVAVDEDAPLVIDCITSKTIKRELEVAFLRREAMQARVQFRQLRSQVDTQRTTIRSLETTLEYIARQYVKSKRLVADREQRLGRQQRQIEQLQVQMKTLLQVLHANNGGVGVGVGASVSGASLLSSTSRVEVSVDQVQDESVRALDAALARDLGRKCSRDKQFVLAQTYFERSLELFPLPGVAKMLDEAKRSHRDAVAEAERVTNAATDDRADELARLREQVSQVPVSESTRLSLEREILKLEAMDTDSPAYAAALKWLEWLLALPWSEDDGTRNVLSLEATAFDELERLEQEQEHRRQERAACVIQRAFREQYAMHLMRRAVATSRIQKAYSWYLKRQRIRLDRMEIKAAKETQSSTDHQSDAAATTSAIAKKELQPFDAARDVDTRAIAKLRVALKQVNLRRGHAIASTSSYHLLQLLQVNSAPSRRHVNAEAVRFYVWKAWGPTVHTIQSSVSGPYEDAATASSRFDRLLREIPTSESSLAPPVCGTTKEPAVGSPSWSSLRAQAS